MSYTQLRNALVLLSAATLGLGCSGVAADGEDAHDNLGESSQELRFCGFLQPCSITIVTSGALPWFTAIGSDFVSAVPGVRQWGRTIAAQGLGGLPGGDANGYEIEALVSMVRSRYQVRIVQMPWSGTPDKSDLSSFLVKDPSELRSYLVAQNALGANEPLIVANAVATTDARRAAGWSFTNQPHYRSSVYFGAHRALGASELQAAKNKQGADAINDDGVAIEAPSSTLNGKVFTLPGNLFNTLMISYGIDPATQTGKTSVMVGGLELVSTAAPKVAFAADATSFILDLNGTKPAPGLVRLGVPFRSKSVTLEAGTNPGFGIAPSPTCRAGRDCLDDLRAILDRAIVRRICDGRLDQIAEKYEPGLKLAPPASELTTGFQCE